MHLMEDVLLETLERPRNAERIAPPAPSASNHQVVLPQGAGPPQSPPEAYVEKDDGLLRTAGPIMMACYGIAFAAAVVTFMGSGEALFAVIISIGFAVMFFTMPLLMMRVRARHDARWQPADRYRQSDQVDTYTGPMERTSAVTHMVIVPIAVAIAFVSFSVIWTVVRP